MLKNVSKFLMLTIIGVGMVQSASANEYNVEISELEWAEKSGDVVYSYTGSMQGFVAAKIDLNGVNMQISPVEDASGSSSSGHKRPHFFLQKGENKLEVYIRDATLNPTVQTPEEISFTIWGQTDTSDFPGDSDIATEIKLRLDKDKVKDYKYVYTFNLVNVPPMPTEYEPQEVATLTDEDQSQIHTLIKDTITAIQNSDAKKLMELMTPSSKIRESKSYLEYSEENEKRDIERKLKYLSPTFANKQFDFNDLNMVSVVEGKYWVVNNKQGGDFLFTEGYKGQPLALSKNKDGKWFISSTMAVVKDTPFLE